MTKRRGLLIEASCKFLDLPMLCQLGNGMGLPIGRVFARILKDFWAVKVDNLVNSQNNNTTIEARRALRSIEKRLSLVETHLDDLGSAKPLILRFNAYRVFRG